MNTIINKNNLILKDVKNFSLSHVFDCGQSFRWNPNSDGSYTGVALGKALRISQQGDTLTLYDTTQHEFDTVWRGYFDLDRDYAEIRQTLAADPFLQDALAYGSGVRILNQDLWETVASFLISSSNNIPRIKQILETLCRLFGNKIQYMGDNYYSFPSPKTIASLSLEELKPIRAGYRDKYLLDAGKKFADGTLSPDLLAALPTPQAKERLMTIYGVGTKVADCILLFGLGRTDSFPVDVWMKRIMEALYFHKEQPIKDIMTFSQERFGQYSGYAQQYLFFYARENKLGIQRSAPDAH